MPSAVTLRAAVVAVCCSVADSGGGEDEVGLVPAFFIIGLWRESDGGGLDAECRQQRFRCKQVVERQLVTAGKPFTALVMNRGLPATPLKPCRASFPLLEESIQRPTSLL